MSAISKPTILFMGTPAFAVPALQGLVAGGWPVIAVVTQPDRPRGRGRTLAPAPVKVAAEDLHLPVLQPEKVRDPGFLGTFRTLAPALVVVAAFGQILPKEILRGAEFGCVNIHPSLLPKYRGAAPVNRAIMAGEERTGVTIMQMDEGLDSGPILLQEEAPIGPAESFGELQDRLALMGAELLRMALAMVVSGTIRPRPQDHGLATFAPKIDSEEGRIDWAADCRQIAALVRGLSPTPCAYTFLKGKKLRIFAAAAEPADSAGQTPGTVAGERGGFLRIAAGNGYVQVKEVQAEGKRRMAVPDFLRGSPIATGQVLG